MLKPNHQARDKMLSLHKRVVGEAKGLKCTKLVCMSPSLACGYGLNSVQERQISDSLSLRLYVEIRGMMSW